MKKYFLVLILLVFSFSAVAGFGNLQLGDSKAVVISLDGQILPTSEPSAFSSGGAITPDEVRDLNSRAREKENVEAVIYELNSPGGAVVASKEVMRAIESVDMPTVCRFRDAAASGAYLASLGCDEIVADSASLTGSIGVKSSYLEFSEVMEDYGVKYVNITAGKYKEVGSPYMNISEEEKKILKKKTDRIHEQFVSQVTEVRNLSEKQEKQVSTGELFLGSTAQDKGLVDKLGGRKTAVESAENLTGEELEVERIDTGSDFNFLSLLTSSSVSSIFEKQPLLKAKWR